MTHRGGSLVKRTMPTPGIGRVAVACPPLLPLFEVPELDAARTERARLISKLARGGVDARSRIRTEQKLNQIVAKILRLEMQIGGRS